MKKSFALRNSLKQKSKKHNFFRKKELQSKAKQSLKHLIQNQCFMHRLSQESAEVHAKPAKPSPILQAKSISMTSLWLYIKSSVVCVKLIPGT